MEKSKEHRDNYSPDPNLDTPSESNTNKHINFLDTEDDNEGNKNRSGDREVASRREQWQQGLEEGSRQKDEQQKRDSTPDSRQGNSSIPMDEEDTLGNP
ncbi:MAG TPA: hypothetical protein VFR58_12375 [Flavisolibacter sp.]|nr:hypothetical protein [Flavisolibacter sp.]